MTTVIPWDSIPIPAMVRRDEFDEIVPLICRMPKIAWREQEKEKARDRDEDVDSDVALQKQ